MSKFNVYAAVRTLLEQHPELDRILKKYLSEQTFNAGRSLLLSDLSILLLNENFTIDIATFFSPILLDLLSRASDVTRDNPITKHEWLCICLSKLIWYFPDVVRFTKLYFEKSFGFFCRYEDNGEPPSKKHKSEMGVAPAYELLKAANLLLIYDTQTFKDVCDWSILTSFLNSRDPRTRWFAYQCLGRVGNIKNIVEIMDDKFSDEERLQCIAEENKCKLWTYEKFRPFKVDHDAGLPKFEFKEKDLCKEVVNIEGVLLSRNLDYEGYMNVENFVYAPSVRETLFRLALAVSAGESVLLQGPVGCGKTSIIEHLAALTGRRPFEDLLKVQLGDHMDSKMLLGTLCCTEIPGEFIWKSGVLVQAMTEGQWLLLEDIDCAPMDVISLLVPVLQSRTVALPGHANTIKAAAGFQLFATQRLITGHEGSYVEFRSNTRILEGHFRKILMKPMSKIELKRVISAKWISLEKASSRILDIYSLFSAELRDNDRNESGPSKEPLNLINQHGRLVSTRDLFKFCERIHTFCGSKRDANTPVFQNAVECFCDSIPSVENRLSAAESIGAKINIPAGKASFLCQKKPTIEMKANEVTIGRVSFPIHNDPFQISKNQPPVFAYTRQSSLLLEKISIAVAKKEPVLLVGETGTGKTSVVQCLAHLTDHKLTVINMNQQSDSVDLIGGYKPVDLALSVKPIKDRFIELFTSQTVVNSNKNEKYMHHISNCFHKKKYDYVAELMLYAQENILKVLTEKKSESAEHVKQISVWKKLGEQIAALKHNIKQTKNTLIFKFIEGALVKAMKKGDWLLLDEINLAEAEILECLAGILEKDKNTLFLFEKGSKEPVARHPEFRIFACMNPATDIGKKDLPVGIRNRFTEFFVDEIEDKEDLTILVQEYLKCLALKATVVENIVKFYLHIKRIATQELSDGTGHYPHYSLRTLCRALKYASKNPCHNVPRSLYEAFCLSFLSQLDNNSHGYVMKLISEKLLGDESVLKQSIPEPRNGKYIPISGYWIRAGEREPVVPENYIFTATVQKNLQDLARIVSACQYPVLIQGDTSVGKTSLIQWLAKASGNVCVRVNNHEHTDIQEYVGTYCADATGKLVFKEGLLAEAMRNGHWIILDELNLAPTEVMEALNRVLDDNRELFIPETQTLIKAHPGFMIFATQNPPGLYGGRKLLSRAFRNRFIELHFNEIPPKELEVILHRRCSLPLSYSQKLVAVMHDLQVLRRESGVFYGKQGFITLRDLFRWGERYQKTAEPSSGLDWLQHLANEGYLLLAGRVRLSEETRVIADVLHKHLKRKVNPGLLFSLCEETPLASKDILAKVLCHKLSENFRNVVWTYNMRRLAVLVGKAMQYQEPVLLIGTTGSGKTTICQIFAEIFGKSLHSVNCHMHSESTDFLGGLRPVRDHEQKEMKLFEWVDGPLIKAMKEGNFFLCDEISLADDSVLERLNSVLEPEQRILVPERSFETDEEFEIIAKSGFLFFATMNPGGDYGKKELSPALRNRFTEIWCPNSLSEDLDVIAIVEHNVSKKLKLPKYASLGEAIAEFLDFYSNTDIGRRTTLSIRDILTWVEFINLSSRKFVAKERISAAEAYVHGAFLAIIDGVGSGSTFQSNEDYLLKIKRTFFDFLMNQVKGSQVNFREFIAPELFEEDFENMEFKLYNTRRTRFGLGPFTIDCGGSINDTSWQVHYTVDAITTKINLLKILRAMQLSKPILLEGSPGVGKTSLISTLAKATGHSLVRINLSEQTDISDLFGADLPVDGGDKGEFSWRDGPLIQALKNGDWILLDELNLASQSVLEGLNACLDHRNQIYIPELGRTFYLDKNISRIFCCQNPQRQGGSRKGLPQSFLNRFNQVYIKPLQTGDMEFIATLVYTTINPDLISLMVQFNNEVSRCVNVERTLGQYGGPWEFNLRDIFRWCDLLNHNQSDSEHNIGEYVKMLYMDRMRTKDDREQIHLLFENLVERSGYPDQSIRNRNLKLSVFEKCVQLGHSFLYSKRVSSNNSEMICIPPAQLPYLESLMKCIEMNWMPILVGPSGSGKSTLVRQLAELCGQELHILSVNSDMDTIELLGGFEQADISRKIEYVALDLQPAIETCILKCIETNTVRLKKLQELLYQQYNVKQTIFAGTSLHNESWSKKLNCLKDLIKVLESFRLEILAPVLSSSRETVQELIEKSTNTESFSGGKFEWVDSMLVNAAKKGHWILIDDANFCSSSVLDRLNALLEPGGVLTINEQGIIDGKLRTIVPHKNFRIILALNPRNGEISRAMRNRGIEIYIQPIVTNMTLWHEKFNASVFAQCKGLIHNHILKHFCDLYQSLTESPGLEPPTITDFNSAVSLCVQMIQKHGSAAQAFRDSCIAVFAESKLNASARTAIINTIVTEASFLEDVKIDYSIPIIDLLPTSFDYRQGTIFAALKRQACLYTVFYKDFIGRIFECSPYPDYNPENEAYFVCPPPKSFSSKLQTIYHCNDVKRFTIVMRIVFESCPIQCLNFMTFSIRNWFENFIPISKETDKEALKIFYVTVVKRYEEMIPKLTSLPLMKNLSDTVEYMFREVEYAVVSKDEVPYDLRWNSDIYQKIMMLLRKLHDDPDSIEFEFISRANRCSLLLLFYSLRFMNESPTIQNCKNLATCAEEIVKNPYPYKDSPLQPLTYLPKFVEALTTSILKFMEDESLPCNDEYYWKLFEIISSYSMFQRYYTMHAERGLDVQLKCIALHLSWLLKKINNLYHGVCNLPPALTKAAEELEMHLTCNSPIKRFRGKYMKWLGRPSIFVHEKTTEFYKCVSELFPPLDMINRIKSSETSVQDLKIIHANMKSWFTHMGNAIFSALYEPFKCDNIALASLDTTKAQMIQMEIIPNPDSDIIPEPREPALEPSISNRELSMEMQLLPLWDYLFITYEAEVLASVSAFTLQNSRPLTDKSFPIMLVNWGSSILGLDPVHMTQFATLLQCKFKQTLIPALLYFLRHTRHGFSSDGLSVLDLVISGNKIHRAETPDKYWSSRYSWASQHPLLTHIFSSVFGKSNGSSSTCHIPLGAYSEKIKQLKKVQSLVWKHFDKLACTCTKQTFRYNSACIIISWFTDLLTALESLAEGTPKHPCNILDIDNRDVWKLAEQLKITPLIRTESNDNILFLTTESVIELKAKLQEGVDDSKLQWTIGKAYALVGLLTSMLLMPRDHLDPGMKIKAKYHAYKEICATLLIEKDMRAWVNDVTCGLAFDKDWVPEHPHISGLMTLFSAYEKKVLAIEKKVPFRPNDDVYNFLKSDIMYYSEHLGSPVTILDLIAKLNLVNNMTEENDLSQHDLDPTSIIQKALLHARNMEAFVDTMLKKYAFYPDLILPFLVGVEQVIFGLSMSCHSLTIKEAVNNDPPDKLWHLNEIMEQYSQISMDNLKSPLCIASTLLNGSAFRNFHAIFSLAKEYFPNRGQLLYKLMKSIILELNNEIKFQLYLPQSKLQQIKELMFSAFLWFYKEWQLQDEERKRKLAEEAEMYKTTHHEDELSDEEKTNKELKEMFPFYEEEFSDIVTKPMDTNDSSNKPKLPTGNNSVNYDSKDSIMFSDHHMFEVCQLHATLLSLLTDTTDHVQHDNLYVKSNTEVDILTPLLLRHEVMSSIITTLGHRLDSGFEKNFIKEQLLLSYELQKLKGLEEDEYYDIYHDPNPAKVLTINPILQKLVNHANCLLEEFPENPNLIQIVTVTQRVLSFPVSEPLMKFVVGLEYILEAAQVWEQNAHSKVSIREEIDEITKKVLEFRALELNMWKKGLQNIVKKQYVKSSKWWFFMFPLFYTDNTYAESEKAVIKKGLQQCLENSPIGEFPARLSILRTFLQEFHLCSPTKQNRSYGNILFNVYTYYEQFLPAVNNEIMQIRKPIEKDIKDFVKIARWNDLNFYAVKASVEKSHRTVLKHIKAFENALQKPAKLVFNLPSKRNQEDNESSWILDIKERDFIYDIPTVRSQFFKNRSEPFFKKFPKYQKKIKKLSKQIAETFPAVGYVNVLNEFCGNIIEALEGATADGQKAVCTRSREKKQALLKIQNKKHMLATLFKSLKSIGLSWGLGKVRYNEDRVTELMSIPAFDVSKMEILKTDYSFKKLLSNSSCDTNHYFYKSLAQFAQLQRFMESPCKDLTLDIIHRIQGYGGHLLTLVSSQRVNLVKLMKDIDSFGCFLTKLSDVYKKQDFEYEKCLTIIPPQQYFQESNLEMCNFIEVVSLAVNQFDILLDCAPESNSLSKKEHVKDLDKKRFASVEKDEHAWLSIKQKVNAFNVKMRNILQNLSELKFNDSVVSWEHLRTFSGICQAVHTEMEKLLLEISGHCTSDTALIQNLCHLHKQIEKKCAFAKEEEEKILDSQMTGELPEESEQSQIFAVLCQKLATQVVLGIQEMFVLSASTEEDKDENNVVPDNLLTHKITGSLLKTKDALRFEKISKLIGKLKRHFNHFQNSTDTLISNDKSFRLLVNLSPLLNQYFQLIKVHLAVSLGMHRTSCKFLTILLEIFIILTTKGFCIPQELQEEAAKADATKFEDIEEGGLGEGEGTKDVSSKIESEDQLDDALQEGQEKKENDDSKDKELKDEEEGIEMSEDFEGKLHSGDGDNEEDSDEDENKDLTDLDKQMGDVEADESEKIDDKVWGSDSEDEEQDLRDEEGTGGMTENTSSELAAKDNQPKEDADDGSHEKENKPQEVPIDQPNDEYDGEHPDPMVDAQPVEEPEAVDLPENMEITDEVEKDGEGENPEDIAQLEDTLEESKDESGENKENEDTGQDKEGEGEKAHEDEGGDEMEGGNTADQDDFDQPTDESQEENEFILPTLTPTNELQALPSFETKKSSSDPVQTEESMDWESGAQSGDDQHKEGLSDAANLPMEDAGHEGKKSSAKTTKAEEPKQNPKLKPPSDNRSVDVSADEHIAKKRPVMDKKSKHEPSEDIEDVDETAEMYEHVSEDEKSTTQAMDIASQEQAEIRSASNQDQKIYDDEQPVIELSSDEEEPCEKAVGDTLKSSQGHKPGERGNRENESADFPEGEIVPTYSVSRGAESTIHTQNELWQSMSSMSHPSQRLRHMVDLSMTVADTASAANDELWRRRETSVANLSQELCEQLRLVLEPTKMSKFKGDYRTGKRLNMRKIIPYIASQFRKDKIWLRRTKPSKRQYQIMLAIDDSKSMSYNNVKELAFESLAVLGQSLTLLEAGDLSVVSFGENVQLLHGFQDQFSSNAGAKILERVTFLQNQTKIAQLLDYATDAMLQARNISQSSVSKETAQLLIIISDGRNIFGEGQKKVKTAVKRARDSNIFMVYVVLDNVDGGNRSVLDTKHVLVDGEDVIRIPYMDLFPFPFYIILREITALPQVLGEALRQWFELVTSVDR